MEKITKVAGLAIPVVGDDIDTDRIIPARYMKAVTFAGLEKYAFADARKEGGHPFDAPQYQGASILLVNKNFGCGSSREHAPQALQRWGIKAIVGESFAEIFFGNCVAMGVPCVSLQHADIKTLMALANGPHSTQVAIDLEQKVVTAGTTVFNLTINESARQQFVTGTWDAMGVLYAAGDQIEAMEKKLPYLHFSTNS